MKKVKIIVSGIFFLLAFLLLVFFPEVNTTSTGKVPMGTYIAWFAVLTYSMFWYYILPDYLKFFRYIKGLKNIHFLLALSWGFFSALLADNWQFSFQNRQTQFEIWIVFTGCLVVTPLLLLVFLGVRRLIYKNK